MASVKLKQKVRQKLSEQRKKESGWEMSAYDALRVNYLTPSTELANKALKAANE